MRRNHPPCAHVLREETHQISSLHINTAYRGALSLHTEDVPYDTSRSFHTHRCQRFHLLAGENCFSSRNTAQAKPRLELYLQAEGDHMQGTLTSTNLGFIVPFQTDGQVRAHGKTSNECLAHNASWTRVFGPCQHKRRDY